MGSPSVEHIRQLTQRMRHSDEAYWPRVRAALTDKGVEVERSWLADAWPEDYGFELGYVVTGSGDVYRFGFNWRRGVNEGVFSEWVQLSNDLELESDDEWAIASEAIRSARQLLQESGG